MQEKTVKVQSCGNIEKSGIGMLQVTFANRSVIKKNKKITFNLKKKKKKKKIHLTHLIFGNF
jgi:hypothetical protein